MDNATRAVFPFGGNVTQAFDIFKNFGNFAGAKIGFFVNLGRSRNPAVEDAVLDEFGSYGRQIGRIADSLQLVIGVLEKSNALPDPNDPILTDFRNMMQHIRLIKDREAKAAGEIPPATEAESP